jgi:hypothetical protein
LINNHNCHIANDLKRKPLQVDKPLPGTKFEADGTIWTATLERIGSDRARLAWVADDGRTVENTMSTRGVKVKELSEWSANMFEGMAYRVSAKDWAAATQDRDQASADRAKQEKEEKERKLQADRDSSLYRAVEKELEHPPIKPKAFSPYVGSTLKLFDDDGRSAGIEYKKNRLIGDLLAQQWVYGDKSVDKVRDLISNAIAWDETSKQWTSAPLKRWGDSGETILDAGQLFDGQAFKTKTEALDHAEESFWEAIRSAQQTEEKARESLVFRAKTTYGGYVKNIRDRQVRIAVFAAPVGSTWDLSKDGCGLVLFPDSTRLEFRYLATDSKGKLSPLTSEWRGSGGQFTEREIIMMLDDPKTKERTRTVVTSVVLPDGASIPVTQFMSVPMSQKFPSPYP